MILLNTIIMLLCFIHIFSTHLDNIPWPNRLCKYLSNEINIGHKCHNNGQTFTYLLAWFQATKLIFESQIPI